VPPYRPCQEGLFLHAGHSRAPPINVSPFLQGRSGAPTDRRTSRYCLQLTLIFRPNTQLLCPQLLTAFLQISLFFAPNPPRFLKVFIEISCCLSGWFFMICNFVYLLSSFLGDVLTLHPTIDAPLCFSSRFGVYSSAVGQLFWLISLPALSFLCTF